MRFGRSLAWIGFLGLAAVAAERPANLEEASQKQSAVRAGIEEDFKGRKAALQKWYGEQLDAQQKAATSRGDLDTVLIFRSERERMEREFTPQEQQALSPLLQPWRAKFEAGLVQLTAMQRSSEATALRQYVATLEELQKRLTQKGEIDEALKVKAEKATEAELLSVIAGSVAKPPPATPVAATPLPPVPPPASAAPGPEALTLRLKDSKWSMPLDDKVGWFRLRADGTVAASWHDKGGTWRAILSDTIEAHISQHSQKRSSTFRFNRNVDEGRETQSGVVIKRLPN